jgi:hypothetical protein
VTKAGKSQSNEIKPPSNEEENYWKDFTAVQKYVEAILT